MTALDGIAASVSGIEIPNVDAEKLLLEQLLATCIEPRLPRVDIEAVETSNSRHIIIVRVPRSWIGPHRVTLNDKFYGRNSAGKYPLDVSELRNAFVLPEATVERIRTFRAERLVKITTAKTPIRLHPGGRIVIHAVGVDRPVLADRIRKSIGAENTFSVDLFTFEDARDALAPIIDKARGHCESSGTRGRTVTLKIKYADFQQITCSHSIRGVIDGRMALEAICLALLRAQYPMTKGIRLLGISISALSSAGTVAAEQLPLGL